MKIRILSTFALLLVLAGACGDGSTSDPEGDGGAEAEATDSGRPEAGPTDARAQDGADAIADSAGDVTPTDATDASDARPDATDASDASDATDATVTGPQPPGTPCSPVNRILEIPCGFCGKITQVCFAGGWGGPGSCLGESTAPDRCMAGTPAIVESCGLCGTRTTSCQPNCTRLQSACLGEVAGGCVPGRKESSTVGCEPGEARERTCQPGCTWGPYPPDCSPQLCPSGMAAIPADTYMMGSIDPEGQLNERPVHTVNVGAFCMDVTEVTVDAYTACVTSGACTPAAVTQYCNWGQAGRGNDPINCVDFDQASAYCTWAGKRLPDEEEWEYAARGTDGRKYPWGPTPVPLTQLCWSGLVARAVPGPAGGTCPAGSYPAGRSPFGLDDMAGNVWEWINSGYSVDYTSPRNNASRIVRGGSWIQNVASAVRGAIRVEIPPATRADGVGFRCAR